MIYPQIDVSTVDGLPQWFGNNVVLSQKVFNPDAPADINVVPGGGSDVTRYDLASSRGEVAFQTVGQPGVYFFSGSFDNRPALDIEVRRTAWDSERNRGIINVCARNRSPEGVQSDDICYLYLVDATTFEELNTEVNGFAPKWSSSGQLAYYYDNQLFVAEVSGSSITPRTVYRSGSLLQALDWSPNGSLLVFAERASFSSLFNDGVAKDIDIYTIRVLDVVSGRSNVLLQVDHGSLGANISWSPDGDFIVYTLLTEEKTQVWWLEVATGRTGPITTTTDGYAASWQK